MVTWRPRQVHVSGAWLACASHPARLGRCGAGRRFGVCFNEGASYGGVCSAPQYVAAACGMSGRDGGVPAVGVGLGPQEEQPHAAFLTPVLRNIIISLARLPLVNSYTRVRPW